MAPMDPEVIHWKLDWKIPVTALVTALIMCGIWIGTKDREAKNTAQEIQELKSTIRTQDSRLNQTLTDIAVTNERLSNIITKQAEADLRLNRMEEMLRDRKR